MTARAFALTAQEREDRLEWLEELVRRTFDEGLADGAAPNEARERATAYVGGLAAAIAEEEAAILAADKEART